MNVAEVFKQLTTNIRVDDVRAEKISNRYRCLTKALNKKFRNTESEITYSLQVGSYGRYTGIRGISDLDMIYIMPNRTWVDYNINGGQKKLLEDVKAAISKTYSTSTIKLDRCVVTILYNDAHIDIQPVFEIEEQDYKYPDTYNGGSWKVTKPRKEMAAMKEANSDKNNNLRMLCKMMRAWKNKSGACMGGLLIDTLAYNFLNSTNSYDTVSYSSYDKMCRDFFKFIYDRPKDQKEYCALGSNQRVKVHKSFNSKAKKAYDTAVEAISAEKDGEKHSKWRDIFGTFFPKYEQAERDAKCINPDYRNSEEFISDTYSINIKYDVKIDCEVKQNGFRDGLLREFLMRKIRLQPDKSLRFYITNISVPEPYEIKWKVTNRGDEAIRRNCIRGNIINDAGSRQKIETTNFNGNHFVECYIVKDNEVVAIDSIDVPISRK